VVRRRYTGRKQSFGRGIITFFLIAILALGAGYAFTKYIITPYLIGEEDEALPDSSIIVNQQEVKDEQDIQENTVLPEQKTNQTVKMYCIQFGSFGEKDRADVVVANLKTSKVEAIVIQNDGFYKVLGKPYLQEDTAREGLEAMKTVWGEDIFITTMEAWMK